MAGPSAAPPGTPAAGRLQRAELRVRWGPESLAILGEGVRRAGAQRLLVVTSGSVAARADLLSLLDDATGGRVVEVFAGVRPHSPVEAVLDAVSRIVASGADGIVAVGGGSAMVTARAADIVHGEGRPPAELSTRRGDDGAWHSPRLAAPKLPLWAVPTTPTTATGKAGAALTQPGQARRLAMFDPRTRARGIAVHPDFVATAPDALVVSAALNALCMAFEGLVSVHANLWSEAALVQAGRRLALLLDPRPAALRPDRVELTIASLLAGDGADVSRGGVGAALSHTLGHRHEVPNGVVEAVLLPHVVARVDPGHGGRVAASWALSSDRRITPAEVPGALTELLQRMGTPTRLRDVGVALEDLPGTADAAMGDFAVSSAPGRPGAGELLDLLRRAW